jgi:uncharacterized membrane protein (UPF0182 family)
MRAPTDIPPRHFSLASRRARWVIAAAIVVLVVLVATAHDMAAFYTNVLWFGSVGFTSVWLKIFMVQIGLATAFTVVLFSLIWSNLWLAERLAPLPATLAPGDQFVGRWQELTFGRVRWIRLVVAAVFALVGGISTHSQWQNWILFSNAQPFTSTSAPSGGIDPINHLNDSFYMFRLPFLGWLTGWVFSALVVTFLLCLVAHYLNGGILPRAPINRVSAKVKAHLSVLLALLALVQGARYYLERLSLVLSSHHIVDGATYTDVHATRPALVLLVAISVIAAGLFLYNARQQGWLLPTVAVALWALVWLLVANLYPLLVQTLVVTPAENLKEQPYIADNIAATTWAYGLQNVATQPFQGNSTVTSAQVTGKSAQSLANEQSIANIPLLDPSLSGINSVFTKQQGFRPYYTMSGPSTDRYDLSGPNGQTKETQVLISARELDSQGAPSTWVSQHLQYTHGYGAVVVPANQSGIGSDGYPNYTLSGLPPTGQPSLGTQPRIYYSTNSQIAHGYVVAGSDQPEIDYENPSSSGASQVYSHYTGSGGVKAGGLLRRLAFSLSFGDYNILLSGQVDSSSRVLYNRGVVQRLQKVAPFLTYGSNPYPVITNGSLYWVVDAYTTSNNFPYSEQANTTRLPSSSGLANQKFNYIRNSVKAVVNAYTGKTWFFVMYPNDPVIETYVRAFPSLFTPMSAANHDIPGITAHWRYPQDMYVVQTNMWQRYHQQNPTTFYENSQAWSIAENPAAGEVASASSTSSTSSLGALASQAPTPSPASTMPSYELVALPGNTQQSFQLVQAFVPASTNAGKQTQTLTAFIAAGSDGSDYGQLTEYTIPSGEAVDGPYLVSTAVDENYSISQVITLLDQANSKVVLGNVILTPIGQSLLYTQPLFVEQSANQVPSLQDVIVVYDGRAFQSGTANPTLSAALCNVTNPQGGHPFASYCPSAPRAEAPAPKPKKASTTPSKAPSGSTTTTSVPPTKGALAKYLADAQQDFALANAALKRGDLAAYQHDIQAAESLVALAGKLAGSAGTHTTTTTPQGAEHAGQPSTASGPSTTTTLVKHSALLPSSNFRAQPLDQRSALTR